MKKNPFNKNGLMFRSFILIAVCFAVSVAMYFLDAFSYFENKTYDIRMRAASKYVHASDDIVFIGVDQKSLDWAKENRSWNWPWPREAYAQIVDFISAGNPKSIAFDILFTEPSVYGAKDDFIFGKAEEECKKVIQTVFISENNGKSQVLFPILEIKENAAIIANITSLMDSDDIIRRTRIGFEHENNFYPSLGFAPLYLENKEPDFKDIPVQKDGSVLLRYASSANDYLPYSAMEILKSYDDWKSGKIGTFVPEDFEDFYVFLIAHIAKHYRYGGTGIRSLLDLYVYEKALPALDFDYINSELEKIGLLVFSGKIRKIARDWYSGGFNGEFDLMSEYIVSGGVYGIKGTEMQNSFILNNLDENIQSKKIKNFFGIIFLNYNDMKIRYPILENKKFLLPLFWIVRFFDTLLHNPYNAKGRFNDSKKIMDIDDKMVEIQKISGIKKL